MIDIPVAEVTEALHYELTSITAFIFNLVLCVMLVALAPDEKSRNSRFTTVSFVVLVGNLISCICYFFRQTGVPVIPEQYRMLLRLVPWLANAFLTYYFERYIESFFGKEHTPNKKVAIFNHFLLLATTVLAIIYFTVRVIIADRVSDFGYADTATRMLVGFVVELYFLICAAVVFVKYSYILNRRAFITGSVAFAVTIGGIVMELANKSGILFNYLGAVLGLYIFYFGVETPDYRKLAQTMEELTEAKEMADRASRSKSDFLANMSHEIRTPINAVLGMNEMILRESDDEKITEYARNVDNSGKTLLSIINDILDISKIEAGKLIINEAPYKLSRTLNDVTNMVTLRAESKDLEFDVFVDETLPDGLIGDELRVRQIMTNLLTNAVKYTKEGHIAFTVDGSYEGDILNLIIKVSDTGIGIKEEDIQRLFNKFERMDMVNNNTVEGTGLGLAITHDLAELMGGSVSVDSKYGYGSTFTVNIPQKIASREQVGNFRGKHYGRSNDVISGRTFIAPDANVLVVDDTRVNLLVFRELLKRTEVRIDVADGAKEALIMAEKTRYDVMFMDQRMPYMDGTEVMKNIRSKTDAVNYDTPIICLTADAVAGAKEKYLDEGFDDYLSKPIVSERLEEMLIKYLPSQKVIRTQHGKDA